MNLSDLPCELYTCIVRKYITTYSDLLNLKTTCKSFDNLIPVFYLNKNILEYKFAIYIPIRMCVNENCYYDTCDIYEDIYHYGYRRYIHTHQYALNHSTITINKEKHNICIPYCCECFKQFVLIGDNNNTVNHLIENKVDIEYL